MERFLYVAPHANKPIFKIGIAHRPQERLRQIAKEFGVIDPETTWVVKGPSAEIHRLEQVLHWTFGRWRLHLANGGGKTEWFSQACLSDLLWHLEALLAAAVVPMELMPYLAIKRPAPRLADPGAAKERQRRERVGRYEKFLRHEAFHGQQLDELPGLLAQVQPYLLGRWRDSARFAGSVRCIDTLLVRGAPEQLLFPVPVIMYVGIMVGGLAERHEDGCRSMVGLCLDRVPPFMASVPTKCQGWQLAKAVMEAVAAVPIVSQEVADTFVASFHGPGEVIDDWRRG